MKFFVSLANRKPVETQQTIVSAQLREVVQRQKSASERVIESVRQLLEENEKIRTNRGGT